MVHYVLKRLWISFISSVIWKKPSVVAMVNDLYSVNCNFLQLLVKWLRLLFQISTVLTLIYLSRRNLLNARDFFPSSTFKVIIQYLQGVWEVGDERDMKQVLFSYCCNLPQAELPIIVGHWTKDWRHICQDSLVIHESCMWHKCSSLLYRSPNRPDKIEFWAFLCFSLEFSPFSSKIILFINFCDHYMTPVTVNAILQVLKRQILIVCTSCKTLYNVQGDIHVILWGLGYIVSLRDGLKRGIDVGGTVIFPGLSN